MVGTGFQTKGPWEPVNDTPRGHGMALVGGNRREKVWMTQCRDEKRGGPGAKAHQGSPGQDF